jgi:hypothetical protein
MHGDGPELFMAPIIILGFLAGSYFLRPADRRLPG